MIFADVFSENCTDITMNMARILARYRTGLTVSQINAQNLNSKLDEFRLAVCVSEIWHSNSSLDGLIGPEEYQIFRNDR